MTPMDEKNISREIYKRFLYASIVAQFSTCANLTTISIFFCLWKWAVLSTMDPQTPYPPQTREKEEESRDTEKALSNDSIHHDAERQADESVHDSTNDDEENKTSHDSAFKSLGWLDRLLAVWVLLAMAIGILLGNFVPSVGPALQRGKFVGVSIPIGMLFLGYYWSERICVVCDLLIKCFLWCFQLLDFWWWCIPFFAKFAMRLCIVLFDRGSCGFSWGLVFCWIGLWRRFWWYAVLFFLLGWQIKLLTLRLSWDFLGHSFQMKLVFVKAWYWLVWRDA